MDHNNNNIDTESYLLQRIRFGPATSIRQIIKSIAANELVLNPSLCPNLLHELIVANYYHMGGINGLEMLETMRFFLARKFPVDSLDSEGRTPLIYLLGHLDRGKKSVYQIADLLLEFNANPNAMDNQKESVLHHVLSRRKCTNRYLIAKRLVEQGADVNLKNGDGRAPIHVACEKWSLEMLNLLLDNGADVNLGDKYGDTLLHYVARFGGRPVRALERILQHGASVNKKNAFGITPLLEATQQYRGGVCVCLLKYGADLELTDKYGQSPVSWLLERGTYFINTTFLKVFYENLLAKKFAGLTLGEEAQNLILRSLDDKCSEKFKLEMEMLKNERVDRFTSMYDFLRKGRSNLTNYLKNENLVNRVLAQDFSSKYPKFGPLIQCIFLRGIISNGLVDLNKDYEECFEYLKFPLPCVKKIFEYLTDEDLYDFLRLNKVENVSKRIFEYFLQHRHFNSLEEKKACLF